MNSLFQVSIDSEIIRSYNVHVILVFQQYLVFFLGMGIMDWR